MSNRDVFPTENWQWPVTEAEVVTARLGETIGQLRRDRDELMEALEKALEVADRLARSVSEYHGSPIEESADDDLHPVRALYAHIKAGR